MSSESPLGRIITFYSYKGGTGRTMALANVAWILASTGHRVLIIDWDLEAPGLHRYLHPFLEDKELSAAPGLIDFFIDFTTAGRLARASKSGPDDDWYELSASILRYACPIAWDFGEGGGTLDFVPAGRQDAAYGLRVSTFDWREFYDLLGGGVFLEAVKRRLREDYHYILIDSRTGLSDTSGICTVQMPDELVVLFTLNQQSIKGAYAVADSAENQRLTNTGQPGLRIWPVATRVELAEKKRLEAGRTLARATFQRFIKHLPRTDRYAYWGQTEVLYEPFYAYEEVLATFADQPGLRTSMLASMEALATRVTGKQISFKISEEQRQRGRSLYERASLTPTAATRPLVYVSYGVGDTEKAADRIADELMTRGIEVWIDRRNLVLGDNWEQAHKDALARCTAVLMLFGKKPLGSWRDEEISSALRTGKRIVPVLVDAPFDSLPSNLRNFQAMSIRGSKLRGDIPKLASALETALQRELTAVPSSVNPEDPNKGRFGGSPARNGRELAAEVQSISDDWFRVKVAVLATDLPLRGEVQFHLHPPTFPNPIRTVKATNNTAEYEFSAWGAFTVGATADDGQTMLELDLASLPSAPPVFRER